MSKITGKPPTHWRRPITRTYDYNYTLGENYYKPQLEYLDARKARGKTPPSATTYAERLLRYPTSQRSASATRRAEETSSQLGISSRREESSLGRYASLDDLGQDEDLVRRRRQLVQASHENLAESSGLFSPKGGLSGSLSGSRERLAFGEKLLDAVGVKEATSSLSSSQQQQSSSLSSSSRTQQQRRALLSQTSVEEDALDKILAERKNRRQVGFVQTAEADLFTDDPLKSPRLSSKLQSARQQASDMMQDMKQDADATTSRFRSRMRARREREEQEFGPSQRQSAVTAASSSMASSQRQSAASSSITSSQRQSAASSTIGSSSTMKSSGLSLSAQNLIDDDDAETAAILNKVEQIRKRAKARLAAINDDFDFPDLQIESSLATRRAESKSRQALDDDFESDFSASKLSNMSSSGGARSVTVSKRTIRSSYDRE